MKRRQRRDVIIIVMFCLYFTVCQRGKGVRLRRWYIVCLCTYVGPDSLMAEIIHRPSVGLYIAVTNSII